MAINIHHYPKALRQSESTAGLRRVYIIPTLAGAAVAGLGSGGSWAASEIQISTNGGGFTDHAGTMTEVSAGVYSYEYTSGELGNAGSSCIKLVKSGIDNTFVIVPVQVWNMNDVVLGLPAVTISQVNTGAIGSGAFAAGAFNPLLDTARSGHTTAGTVGQSLDLIVNPTSSVANDGLNSATSFKTNLSQTGANHWRDAFLRFTSGALLNQSHRIIAYDGGTKFVTVENAYSGIPASGDTFELVVR